MTEKEKLSTYNEKLSTYNEKAKKASKLFRDIRAGKYKNHPPRAMAVKIIKAGGELSGD